MRRSSATTTTWCAGPCGRVNIVVDGLSRETLRQFETMQHCRMCGGGATEYIRGMEQQIRTHNCALAEQCGRSCCVPALMSRGAARNGGSGGRAKVAVNPKLSRAVRRKPGWSFKPEKRLYEVYKKPIGLADNDDDDDEYGGGDNEGENDMNDIEISVDNSGSNNDNDGNDIDIAAMIVENNRYYQEDVPYDMKVDNAGQFDRDDDDDVDGDEQEEQEQEAFDKSSSSKSNARQKRPRQCLFCDALSSEEVCESCDVLSLPPVVSEVRDRRRRIL